MTASTRRRSASVIERSPNWRRAQMLKRAVRA
jgi:hypothetical protein